MRMFYRVSAIIVAVLVVLVIIGYVAIANQSPPAALTRVVTIDGSDGTGGIIDPVHVWATYEPRGAVVAQLHPGAKVTLLRRVGDGALIRTSDGVEGWVTYWFITGLSK